MNRVIVSRPMDGDVLKYNICMDCENYCSEQLMYGSGRTWCKAALVVRLNPISGALSLLADISKRRKRWPLKCPFFENKHASVEIEEGMSFEKIR